MSLTARLSAFQLALLAVVLASFSIGLYVLARTYLYRQVDERLEAALATLVAAAEVSADGVEWEPDQRMLALGRDPAEGQVRWTVRDERGRLVDRSPNLSPGDLPEVGPGVASTPTSDVRDAQGRNWRVLQRQVTSAGPARSAATPSNRHHGSGEHTVLHTRLVMTGAVTLNGVEVTLNGLLFALIGLSVTLLLFAALLARRLCRRALRPVTLMAQAARTISADDLGARLPGTQTRDELEDLGHAFNELLSRVQEAFERQRRFTGDASHQLRTPLTSMLGQLELALRRERSAGDYREALVVAHGQAERLRRIVEALLFLARADSEARLPNLEWVEIRGWLTDHLRQWEGHPRRADIQVEVPPGPPGWVQVQPALLGQLVDNLLENACKYGEAGTPVTVRFADAASEVVLTVADTGCGIAASDLPHIFEPFYRSAQARRQGRTGVGLGLAVALRIAVALGGVLSATSEPGKGSKFVLRLPAASSPGGMTVAGMT